MLISELAPWYRSQRQMLGSSRSVEVSLRALAKQCGDIDHTEINADHVHQFRRKMSDSVRNTTFNSYLIQIQAVFNLLCSLDLVEEDHPVFALKKTKIPENNDTLVSDRDVKKIRQYLQQSIEGIEPDAFPSAWFWLIVFETFYLTGMRRRQLCCLLWSDIDMQAWTIRFRAESSKNGRGWSIPCPTALRPLLQSLKSRLMHKIGSFSGNEPVFHRRLSAFNARQPTSSFIGTNYVTNRIETISIRAGCSNLCSPHKLRHTAATRWLQVSGQIKVVKMLLGHSDGTHSYRYTHPEIEGARAVLHRYVCSSVK